MSTEYHVYANSGAGGPIDYSAPVATVSALTWTSGASLAGRLEVRGPRFDTVSSLEELNLDASVELVLDSGGNDITNRPIAPLAFAPSPRPAGECGSNGPTPR